VASAAARPACCDGSVTLIGREPLDRVAERLESVLARIQAGPLGRLRTEASRSAPPECRGQAAERKFQIPPGDVVVLWIQWSSIPLRETTL
jgi:hypothetical protein